MGVLLEEEEERLEMTTEETHLDEADPCPLTLVTHEILMIHARER